MSFETSKESNRRPRARTLTPWLVIGGWERAHLPALFTSGLQHTGVDCCCHEPATKCLTCASTFETVVSNGDDPEGIKSWPCMLLSPAETCWVGSHTQRWHCTNAACHSPIGDIPDTASCPAADDRGSGSGGTACGTLQRPQQQPCRCRT